MAEPAKKPANKPTAKVNLADWVDRISARPMPVGEICRAAAIEILDSPGRPLADLGAVAERDPMFAVALLRKVNGLREGSGRDPITMIDSAINLLGRQRLQVLAQSLDTTSAGQAKPGRLEDYLRLLDRCALAADFSAHWAHSRGNLNPAEMRICGLTRDLGELALAWFANSAYRRIRIAEYTGQGCFTAMSQRILGFSVSQLGLALAEKWRLPQTIMMAMDARQYQEHRSLAPMLASELARHAVDGWYSASMVDCITVVADYLGVSSSETARQVHSVAVESARSPYTPGFAPPARALLFQSGQVPLPADYGIAMPDTADAAARTAPRNPDSAQAKVTATSSAGQQAAREPKTTVPAPARDPAAAEFAKMGPGRSESASENETSMPEAAARHRIPPAPSDAEQARAPAAIGPAPADAQAINQGSAAANAAAQPAESLAARSSVSADAGGLPSEPAPGPQPGAMRAQDPGGIKRPETAASKSEPAVAPAVRPVAQASIDGASQASSSRRGNLRPPNPETYAKSVARFRQMVTGTPGKSTEIVQSLLRGLHQGLGLPRVVLLGPTKDSADLVLRFQVGPLPGWPKSWRLASSTPSIFERALRKPQCLPIAASMMHQHPSMFPPPIAAQVAREGFWLAAIFAGSRPWGLVYAETRDDIDRAASFRQFSESCRLAGQALAVGRHP